MGHAVSNFKKLLPWVILGALKLTKCQN